jgi:hypothetical protein
MFLFFIRSLYRLQYGTANGIRFRYHFILDIVYTEVIFIGKKIGKSLVNIEVIIDAEEGFRWKINRLTIGIPLNVKGFD